MKAMSGRARRGEGTLLLYNGKRRRRLGIALALVSAAACAGCKRAGTEASPTKEGAAPLVLAATPIRTPTARAAYVTNNGSDTISVLDRDGDEVTTVRLDLDPDAHEAPHHLAVDAASSSVFVALAFPPEPSKKKTKDPHASHGNAEGLGKVLRLDLPGLSGRAARWVDENPGDVVLTHDRKRVLVTHFDMKRAMDVAARGGGSPATMFASLVVLDASTLERIASRAVCVAPHGVAVTRDGTTAFVACYGSDELAAVDLTSKTLAVARHPLGTAQGVPGVPRYGPYSATLLADESKVVVADLEGQDVRLFDRKEKRFEAAIPLAAKAFMPAIAKNGTMLVPLQAPDGLARVDLASSKVTARTTYPKDHCTLPHVVRVAKDGRVYLVCEGDHQAPGSVLEIDADTLVEKRRWVVGVYPDGLAFGDE
jgi:DNA-binding beta-propeller fold protein YncE